MPAAFGKQVGGRRALPSFDDRAGDLRANARHVAEVGRSGCKDRLGRPKPFEQQLPQTRAHIRNQTQTELVQQGRIVGL